MEDTVTAQDWLASSKPHFPEAGGRDPDHLESGKDSISQHAMGAPAHSSRHAWRGGAGWRGLRPSLRLPRLSRSPSANGKSPYCRVWRGRRRGGVASRRKRREVRTVQKATRLRLGVGRPRAAPSESAGAERRPRRGGRGLGRRGAAGRPWPRAAPRGRPFSLVPLRPSRGSGFLHLPGLPRPPLPGVVVLSLALRPASRPGHSGPGLRAGGRVLTRTDEVLLASWSSHSGAGGTPNRSKCYSLQTLKSSLETGTGDCRPECWGWGRVSQRRWRLTWKLRGEKEPALWG